MKSTEFPWLQHLPEEDLEPFLKELAETAVHAISVRDIRALDAIVAAWRSTAEVLSDPEVKETLLTATEGDFGEVSPPFEKHWFALGYQTFDSVKLVYTNICSTCEQTREEGNHYPKGSPPRYEAMQDLSPDALRAFVIRMSDMLGEMNQVQKANRELLKVIEAKNRSLETVDKFLERRDRTIGEQKDALREQEEQLNRVRKVAKEAITDCFDDVSVDDLRGPLGSFEQTNKHGGAL
jgi:hypothetical protein